MIQNFEASRKAEEHDPALFYDPMAEDEELSEFELEMVAAGGPPSCSNGL